MSVNLKRFAGTLRQIPKDEGWDVQNVTSIVGLRPYSSTARILPEQTLGRGLRRMFRGEDVRETLSVIGSPAFIDFVESIKAQGVELDYAPMGPKTPAKSPIVIEVDESKNIEELDIDLPKLSPRLHREYKNLEKLDPAAFTHKKQAYRQEQRCDRFSDRLSKCRWRNIELCPRLPGSVERDRNLDRRNQRPRGSGRSAQVGTAETVVRRCDIG